MSDVGVDAEGLVVIAQIGRPHGIRGALRARPTGPTLTALPSGCPLTVRPPDGSSQTVTLERVTPAGADVLLQLAGVSTRTEAGAFRNALVLVPTELLPAPEEDEFYVRDLIGCVVHVGDHAVGRVVAVDPGPANDVLQVAPDAADGPPLLLPFTRDAVTALDLATRRIRVRGDLIAAGDAAVGADGLPADGAPTSADPGSAGPAAAPDGI